MSRRGERRSLLEVVEALASERFGAASALSIDRTSDGFVVTAWDAKGEAVARAQPAKDKALALAAMRRLLSGKDGMFTDADGDPHLVGCGATLGSVSCGCGSKEPSEERTST